jgi:small subunit ribosomal protein S8
LSITLKYTEDYESVIFGLQRISSPGCREYCNSDSIPKVVGGMGIVILSTSKGIATGKKCEKLGVGGEILCYIW